MGLPVFMRAQRTGVCAQVLRILSLGVFGSLAVLNAQSSGGRGYATGEAWWNAGFGNVLPWDENYDNPDGQVTIKNRTGAIRTKGHAFFDPLGANGRACVTCHQPASAMSVAAATIRQRWIDSNGADPVFAAFDGSNCPSLPQQLSSSHSLAIERGLFRIPLPWPPKNVPHPEFTIEVVSDPAGCNLSSVYGLRSANPQISVYRRPRVVANLETLLSGPGGGAAPVFMADGREPSLESQATNAVLGHEQSHQAPTAEQLRQIVEFETQIYAAQNSDIRAGLLNETGLGVENLARGKAPSLSAIAVSFDPWRRLPNEIPAVQREFRASIARGSDLFFGRTFPIHGVAGAPAQAGTCATCHSAGTTRWMNIGTTTTEANRSTSLPLFKVTCESTGGVVYTQDPGRGLISGKCEEVGSIVVQQFRGLSARAPYFSNGSAKDLEGVVDYYDRRFGIRYTDQERRDLANFLRVL
jgi:cytochrome c peroxidase